MPRDGSGNYTKPAGTTAVDGQVIDAADWNSLGDDIALELTASLPRSGVAPMTGELQVPNGSAADPAVQFTNDPDTGIYRVGANQLGFSAGGTIIASAKLDGATPKLLNFDGTKTYQALATDITAFAATVLDDADAATARTTLAAAGSAITLTAGSGLSGGGDLSANRTFAVDITELTEDTAPAIHTDLLMTYDDSGAANKKVKLRNLGLGMPDIILQDSRASGTASDSLTSGAWATRTLQTEIRDPLGLTSISSSEFALGAGTYYFEINAVFEIAGSTAARCKVRLYNVTDAAAAIAGGTNATSVFSVHSNAFASGVVTIAGTKTFRIEDRTSQTGATRGTAASFASENEIYCEVRIWQVA